MLSHRVAVLEESMQTRLLQRSTRNLSVTEVGERVYQHCQTMLAEAHAAHEVVALAQAEPSGTLRVTCPVLFAQTFIGPLLPKFLNAHSRVKIHLITSDRRVNVIQDGIDVALRIRERLDNDAELAVRQFGMVLRPLVASPAYLAKNGRPVNLEELQKLHILSNLQEHVPQYWHMVDQQGDTCRLPLSPRLISGDLTVLLEAALQSSGVAMLPLSMTAHLIRNGQLEVVLPQWTAPPAIVHAIFPSRRGLLPAVRSWIDFLAKEIPPLLQDMTLDPIPPTE